jgi:hypothetical protein
VGDALGGVREDEATAGASDEREVDELDMELVVNHEHMACMQHVQVMPWMHCTRGGRHL